MYRPRLLMGMVIMALMLLGAGCIPEPKVGGEVSPVRLAIMMAVST